MAKQISYKVQDQWVADQVPAPFEFDYCGTMISVNPALSMEQRRDFCSIVWQLVYSGEFRPYLKDFAIKLAGLSIYTNLKIDLADVGRAYLLAQYTELHTALVNKLVEHKCGSDYLSLEKAALEYVAFKAQEIQTINSMLMSNAQKSRIDILVESVLQNLDTALTKFAADNADISTKEIIDALGTAKVLNDEDKLVSNILDFRFKDKEGQSDDRPREESPGAPEHGGGQEEN